MYKGVNIANAHTLLRQKPMFERLPELDLLQVQVWHGQLQHGHGLAGCILMLRIGNPSSNPQHLRHSIDFMSMPMHHGSNACLQDRAIHNLWLGNFCIPEAKSAGPRRTEGQLSGFKTREDLASMFQETMHCTHFSAIVRN